MRLRGLLCIVPKGHAYPLLIHPAYEEYKDGSKKHHEYWLDETHW